MSPLLVRVYPEGPSRSVAAASAATACVDGNFSTIAGTSCDIGSLHLTFGNVDGVNYHWYNSRREK
jgi:hypothetical protein